MSSAGRYLCGLRQPGATAALPVLRRLGVQLPPLGRRTNSRVSANNSGGRWAGPPAATAFASATLPISTNSRRAAWRVVCRRVGRAD